MFGIFKNLLLDRNLEDAYWLKNQIGKPFKKPGRRGIKRLKKPLLLSKKQKEHNFI